eukprot:SAG31_NODE_2450_length_5668_cov_32.512300_1_plen_31_part_00
MDRDRVWMLAEPDRSAQDALTAVPTAVLLI